MKHRKTESIQPKVKDYDGRADFSTSLELIADFFTRKAESKDERAWRGVRKEEIDKGKGKKGKERRHLIYLFY